jgi:hypothetical protein
MKKTLNDAFKTAGVTKRDVICDCISGVVQEHQLDVIRDLLMDRNSKSHLDDNDRERLHSLYNSYARTSHIGDKSPTGGKSVY